MNLPCSCASSPTSPMIYPPTWLRQRRLQVMAQREAARGEENRESRQVEDASEVPYVLSCELLQGAREVRIVHGQEVYRLLLTQDNQLLLQK